MRHTILSISLALGLTGATLADPFKDQVRVLNGIFLNGQVTRTKATDPIKMIFRYLYTVYLPEDVKEFKIVRDHPGITTDEKIAGTLTPKAAKAAVLDGVKYMRELVKNMDHQIHEDVSYARMAKWPRTCLQALETLDRMGAVFGFDGLRQNEGPTPYLLILDPRTRSVYGMELSPSEF